MAIMLRTLRIPSRVVNGFDTGEFNDLTSQYVVRASDAHSWVEAYFPGYGWISFDPTPASSPAAHGFWNRAAMYLDAVQSFWREWVVNFDFGRQMQLRQSAAQDARQRLQNLSSAVSTRYQALLSQARRVQGSIVRAPRRWGLTSLAIVLLLALAANSKRLVGRCLSFFAPRRRKSPPLAATLWYERMSRTLERQGWHRAPQQTSGEFLDSIEDQEVRSRVHSFTLHYQRARFGNYPEDARQLPELYAAIARKGK
jgi:hypothetical protein